MKKKESVITDSVNEAHQMHAGEVCTKMGKHFNQQSFIGEGGIIGALDDLATFTLSEESYLDCFTLVSTLYAHYQQNGEFARMLDESLEASDDHYTKSVTAGDRLKGMERFFEKISCDVIAGYIDYLAVKTNPKIFNKFQLEILDKRYCS